MKQTIEILKALADETRLGIIEKIAHEEKSVASCDIVSSCSSFLKLSQPAMSHHFSKLVDAGVLIVEKQGTQNLYRVNTELLLESGIDIIKLTKSK